MEDFEGNYNGVSNIPEVVAPNSFVDKCLSLSLEEVEDIKDVRYVQVFNWCTKDKRVEESSLLASDNLELLDKSMSGSDAAWTKVWGAYWEDFKSSDSNPWNIQDWNSLKTNKGSEVPSDFMNKCSIEAKVLVLDREDSVYKNLSKYCTKVKS